jgi:hypothetical protein
VNFGGGEIVSAGADDIFLAKYGDDNPIPVLIERFTALARADAIELSWALWSDEAVESFTLWRARGDAPMIVIAAGDAAVRSYTDADVEPSACYRYQLVIRAAGGDEFRSEVAGAAVPRALASLSQNVPNPFNPRTTIAYTLAERAHVAIAIFDAAGARVARLDQGVREAGTHRAEWTARDERGRVLPSGVYFYRLDGITDASTRKMLLLK